MIFLNKISIIFTKVRKIKIKMIYFCIYNIDYKLTINGLKINVGKQPEIKIQGLT